MFHESSCVKSQKKDIPSRQFIQPYNMFTVLQDVPICGKHHACFRNIFYKMIEWSITNFAIYVYVYLQIYTGHFLLESIINLGVQPVKNI